MKCNKNEIEAFRNLIEGIKFIPIKGHNYYHFNVTVVFILESKIIEFIMTPLSQSAEPRLNKTLQCNKWLCCPKPPKPILGIQLKLPLPLHHYRPQNILKLLINI